MIWGGGGWMSPGQAMIASQQLAAAQAAAKREAAMAKALTSGRKIWDSAQAADKEGNLRLASRLYQRLALTRPRTGYSDAGGKRLAEIQAEALEKLQPIETELADLKLPKSDPTGLRLAEIDAVKVTAAFEKLDVLSIEYAGVATVEDQIAVRIKRLRKDAKFAPILNEPAAADLVSIAQEHEAKSNACCAVLVYEQAAALAPAPSAKMAKERLAALVADKEIVVAVEKCRVLQRCHETYQRAQVARTANPDRARAYLQEIIDVAPADSQVYSAARTQIAALAMSDP